ncbi:hypothetical protein SOVF_105130 [Spinacia oleracea]|nr:hypothetical protein SOVF_105130 [Spinacia oleracea]
MQLSLSFLPWRLTTSILFLLLISIKISGEPRGLEAAKESAGRRDREAVSSAAKERHEGEVCVLAFRGGRIFNRLRLTYKSPASLFDFARI